MDLQAPVSTRGRVVLATRDRFLVWTESGEVEATISGHLRYTNTDHPCAGDLVILREGNVITTLLERRTKLVRKQPGKQMREQVLAANMDVLFIVTGLDDDYNPNRLERYLVLAYESGAGPAILLNKSDLHTESELKVLLERTQRHAPGVPVFCLSALTGQGLEAVSKHVRPAEIAALIGSSGAGKSTIVNCLLGEERQRTADVRDGDSKGRHTTTRRELILVPQGWLLLDLPGLRELQLWADPEQIDQAFCDIAELARNCRFRNCSHQNEPGCAVLEAEVSPQRLSSYHKLQREIHYLEMQTNRHAARELRNKTKAVEKDIRRHPKRQ